MENLVTEDFNSVLQGGHFVTSMNEVYCLRVSCEGCEYIDKCMHVEDELDSSLKTNIRRALGSQRSPKGEWVGDTTKVVVKTFKDKPFDSDKILYDPEGDKYICISGTCLGCKHLDKCKPDSIVQDADPVVFSSDLKAQEPRAYAHFSNEPNWVKLFQNDSIRSTPYLYETVCYLFDTILDTETDERYWVWLDANFFEDRTDLYALVSSILLKDEETFQEIAKYLFLLFAKQVNGFMNAVDTALDNGMDTSMFDTLFSRVIKHFPAVGDFHGLNAVALIGEEIVKDAYYNDYRTFKDVYRDKAKKCGLALNYGGTFKIIVGVFGVSDPEAVKLFDSYFNVLNVFKGYLAKAWKLAVKNMYITTMIGRKIFIVELAITERSQMWKKYSSGKNNVYNYPIQASSAEMIRIMVIKAYNYFTKSKTSKYDINYTSGTTQGSNLLVTSDCDTEALSKFIDEAPLGNVRIIVENEAGEVVLGANRSIGIRWSELEQFNLREAM